MVQITRQRQGGLGLSIKGGAEHKLPILISRIYKDQAADVTGQLFVGDAIIKVNGEYITACPHDDAVNILRNAGDIVVLTVKHYRAATPFLQKQCKCNILVTSASAPPPPLLQSGLVRPPSLRFCLSSKPLSTQTDDYYTQRLHPSLFISPHHHHHTHHHVSLSAFFRYFLPISFNYVVLTNLELAS